MVTRRATRQYRLAGPWNQTNLYALTQIVATLSVLDDLSVDGLAG
jgi:hypothetical protein